MRHDGPMSPAGGRARGPRHAGRRAAALAAAAVALTACSDGADVTAATPSPARAALEEASGLVEASEAAAAAPSSGPATPAPTRSPTGSGPAEVQADQAAPGSPTAAPTAAATSADLPFPADRRQDVQEPSADASLTLVAVRTSAQDGFDRVVFEYSGTGTPGWTARYDDDPAQQGSGDAVEVPGSTALVVLVEGAGLPTDTGVDFYGGPRRLAGDDLAVVTEVAVGSTFEGVDDHVVGTTDQQPFRVFSLEDPPRVVVDVVGDG